MKKAGAKSEKETWPNCIIQLFSRELRDGVCNCLQQNLNVFSFLLNIYNVLTTYLPYFVHSTLSKSRYFDVPWQQIHKFLKPIRKLQTIHTARIKL